MTLHPTPTPLAATLGLKPGMRCWFPNMPADVRAAIAPDALLVDEQPSASDGLHCACLFASDRDKLARDLAALSTLMSRDGFIWTALPATDAPLAAAAVRKVALGLGLAEVAACAVGDNWSALRWTRPPEKH
jgi:hypothetical protein